MKKPTSMVLNELKSNIETALNACELPACVVEPVLFNYWLQIKHQADIQAEKEEKAYREEMTKSKIKEEK